MHIPLKKIKELTLKKNRMETGLFIVEGEKNILELLNSDFEIVTLLATKPFLNISRTEVLAYEKNNAPILCTEVTESILIQTGTLLTNNTGIAVARQKEMPPSETVFTNAEKNIVLILDDIRDPGNLGTIIRTADWYGVTHIVASETTTDCYNPKVIAASMGSFTRVTVTYVELETFLRTVQERDIPIVATLMTGENAHEGTFPKHGFLLLGSESHGVSKQSQTYATHTISIPRFGQAESLNVSVATGILLDTLRRT